MMSLSGAFSSLGINENPSTSKKFSKNRSTISLPNIIYSDKPPPNFTCEDIEKPIDFSKKYGEEKPHRNFSNLKNYNNTFTIYAETDLDQPTDYSLRYAEDDSDSDRCPKKPETEFVQDTVKTYCTEDTPYETPFNFSTSTSMSDLRENKPKEAPKSKIKSTFSSGLMSPEKPVNYCEEGTPGYFSRVASCGSLNSIPEPIKKRPPRVPNEVKAVKFEEVVNYAEETPLMFSRSSSLESLDSIEQHSIHDDRSSVVSDFSRLTSGIISPSELPDSPSQTVPPSPKPAINVQKNSGIKKGESVPKPSVFEDVVKKFKVESTPIEFSTATSLSSLLDEDENKRKEEDLKRENIQLEESSEDEDILAACINIGMQSNRYSQTKSTSPPPPNHHSPTFKYPEIITTHLKKKKQVLNLNTEIDSQKNDVTSDSLRTYCTEGTPALLSHAGSNSNLSILSLKERTTNQDTLEEEKRALLEPKLSEAQSAHEAIIEQPSVEVCRSFSSLSDDSHESEEALLEECILAGMPRSIDGSRAKNLDENDLNTLEDCINNRYSQSEKILPIDTVKNYCTEDTPAILSNAGSCSNLSILSVQGTENGVGNFLSDSDSSDDEKLLEDCLNIGIAAISDKDKLEKIKEASPATSSISLSDDSYESDQDLLQQCMEAGMPKKQEESGDLTPAEKALLQQCILEGMKKCQATQPPKKAQEDQTELTEAEQALLRQCILSGMPKNKNLAQGGPSRHRESTELTESERILLHQCIVAGMPKNRKSAKPSRRDKAQTEHTCCVHCPRANKNRQSGYVRRKKYKEKTQTRDINIVYVTSQILSVTNEVVDRTHENWV